MDFSEKMLGMLNKGMAVSKDIVSKAASQAHVWGEMGVLKVEVIQLRRQAEQLTAQLGAEVYAAFAERKEKSVASDSPALRELIGHISEIGRVIDGKEAAFRKLGGKESDLDSGADI
jgi:hypothetical protein